MKKRFFAALLSFVMVFSLLPVNALAANITVAPYTGDPVAASLYDGGESTTRYTVKTGRTVVTFSALPANRVSGYGSVYYIYPDVYRYKIEKERIQDPNGILDGNITVDAGIFQSGQSVHNGVECAKIKIPVSASKSGTAVVPVTLYFWSQEWGAWQKHTYNYYVTSENGGTEPTIPVEWDYEHELYVPVGYSGSFDFRVNNYQLFNFSVISENSDVATISGSMKNVTTASASISGVAVGETAAYATYQFNNGRYMYTYTEKINVHVIDPYTLTVEKGDYEDYVHQLRNVSTSAIDFDTDNGEPKILSGSQYFDIGYCTDDDNGQSTGGYICLITDKSDEHQSGGIAIRVTGKEVGSGKIKTTFGYSDRNDGLHMYVDVINVTVTEKQDTQPTAPGEEDLSKLIGDITVNCTNDKAAHELKTKSYALISGSYTTSEVEGDAENGYTCTVTINAQEYVKKFKADTSKAHDPKDGTATVTLKYTDNGWTVTAGTPVVFNVACVPEITPPEKPTPPTVEIGGATVAVKCITGHGDLSWKIGSNTFTVGEVTGDDTTGYTCTVTVQAEVYVNAFNSNKKANGVKHTLADDAEKTFTMTYVNGAWTGPTNPAVTFEVKCEEELVPVHLVIYRNGNTSKAYQDIALEGQPKGHVIDLSTIDIADYYTGNYEFYGWYDDGLFNIYKSDPANPPVGLKEKTVNGWTNFKCMVYDYVPVVYFQSKEAWSDFQNDHSKTEGRLYSTTALFGSTLPTADAPTPTRTGYTFKFWSREGQTGDVTGQTVGGWTNLYANWKKDEYTISYDLRDGKAKNSSENPTTYTVEDAIELKDPTTTRDNKFLEWRDEDGKVVTEIKKGTTGNIKLYAYWKCPIKLYEVTNTGKKVQLGETIYQPEGTKYPLPEGTEYAKNGYSFNCWFASEKDLNAEKDRKSEVTTSVEKEWKLYGKNIPIEYTITYDYRDKDITGKAWLQPDNKKAYTVETETFQINPVAKKGESDKVFLEWRDKDGTVVNAITKGTTGNITLYAYWKYPVNYTLKRLDKDGKAVETTKDTDLFIEDHFGEFKLKSVSRDGYTFSGWYEFENLTGACTAITTPKKYELYGTLTPNTNTVYTVEHYLENLDGSYPTDASYTERLTGTTDTFVTAKAQDHTGFTYSDSDSKNIKSGYIAGDGTLVLKLYYTRNSYNVNFYVDGTKADDMTKSVKYQGKVAEPTMDIKTGYAFDGWYTDPTYTAAYKFDETQVTNNLDLYGKYIANTYTVKFNGNGATSGEMTDQTFTYDEAKNLTKNAFAKTGYTFTGWEDDNDNTYKDKQEVVNLTAVQGGVVTLTAQWTADPIAVDISQYVYKQYVQKYNRKDTTTFNFTAEVYPAAMISSASSPVAVFANPLIDTVKGKVKIDSSKNGEVKQVTFEKTDKLSAGQYYVYITENTENKGTNSYITYDNSGYVLNIRVFDNGKTGLDVKLLGINKVGENGQMKTTDDTTVTFVNTYTRASRPSTSSTSKPTLNTGDHYAYVMGYPDGTVRPNGSITRAEVSTILFRLLSDKTREEYFTTESSFTDVKAGAWYNNSVATLEKAGVIVDTAKGGAFRPDEAITRAELAAMLAQFSDAKPVKGVKFSDVSAEHWAYEAIAIAAKMGWIEGYPDGTFRPDATITRAEMMTLVNRALERVPSDEDHLLSKRVMLTFPDCTTRDWFYIAVQEATNSHTYERAATEKNGDEQWTALRDNRDWTKLEY